MPETKKKIWISISLIWVIMFMAFPFSIPQALNLPAKFIMTAGTAVLTVGILINLQRIKLNSSIVFIFLFQILTAFVYFFAHSDAAYINLLFQVVVPMILYIYFSNFMKLETLTGSFIKIMMVMGLLSSICFLLAVTINLPYYSAFKNPDGREAYNFIISFTNTLVDFGSAKFIRPAGYFDEPGTLAFYILIAILLNDLTINNKKFRIILMITGLFTFSIAFYLILAFYSLFYFSKKNFIRMFVGSLLISIIVFSVYLQLDSVNQNIIYGSSIGRLESIIDPASASDNYQADNRTDLIRTAIDAFVDSPLIGQGLSYASDEKSRFYGTFMSANFLGNFGIHGFFGGIIFSLHVFYYIFICFRKKNWLTVPQKSCLIYLLLLLQRPDYIGGVLTYVSVTLLILTSLNFKNVTKNIDYNRSL
ncbi:O-antigen ligase family protein [Flavobacterium sp. TAB 87]|uniref:O-antigen ligase family protein n=1 Tax=Flavobacterium sp. TAB 87 TaxID=1729581 RepID=UPI00076C2121|nr:O-antigen ligase family protein [Flavobacterium sp. TAB 87]KVV13970.1 Lipid A core - O-antigen ligase [Flavobacterium sp. TAB 87]